MIKYNFIKTILGPLLIAEIDSKIFYISFSFEKQKKLYELKSAILKQWPEFNFKTNFKKDARISNLTLEKILIKPNQNKILLFGTEFQKKVWNALLKIPFGQTCTYQQIAKQIQNPKATRAVGTAIGSNSIALLIPCHRVIPSAGGVGQYHWGTDLKKKILDYESNY